jgi:transcriptional regulator with XRE-family HTH domain
LSQERLAFLSDLHPTYISSVERGERNFAVINLLRLSRALDTSPGQLLAGLERARLPKGYKRGTEG